MTRQEINHVDLILKRSIGYRILLLMYKHPSMDFHSDKIRRLIDSTAYSIAHTVKLLNKEGFINKLEREGRIIKLTLTEKGKKLAKELYDLQKQIENLRPMVIED